MDYFAIIPNKLSNPGMVSWLKDNVHKDAYMWEVAPGARAVYFKFEADRLVFRLRWGV